MILTGHLLGFDDESESFRSCYSIGIDFSSCSYILEASMVFSRYRKVTDGPSLNLLHIIIGMIPAGVLGVLFHSAIKEVLFGPGQLSLV